MKKIALEEHFISPGLLGYWQSTMAGVPFPIYEKIYQRLVDFDDLRLIEMDAAGIEFAILGASGPGVQVERDTTLATRNAALANDFLAEKIARHPRRFGGFAHVALQDPTEAARELERCVRDLGFKGVMVNGHTNGRYLDEAEFHPFWEKLEELEVPLYLHPADPAQQYASFGNYKELTRATWGWGVETGTHALRLIFGKVFDHFPKAQLMLGHLGETLPFMLWRLDSRAKLYGVALSHDPSYYVRENIAVTISGMYSREPLDCTIAALGASKVMFSADYPFENILEAGSFMDNVAVTDAVREAIAWKNAAKHLKIDHIG